MQQVLNWITANPAAVMVAGAGVALAIVVAYKLVQWYARRVASWKPCPVCGKRKPYNSGVKGCAIECATVLSLRGAKLAKASASDKAQSDDHAVIGHFFTVPNYGSCGKAYRTNGCIVGSSPYEKWSPIVEWPRHVTYNAPDTPKPVPYGSKPDKSARPVTRAQLEPVLARIAALEARGEPLPHEVRAFQMRNHTRIVLRFNDPEGAWGREADGPWYQTCASETWTINNMRELHGPELRQVYESWVNRSNV